MKQLLGITLLALSIIASPALASRYGTSKREHAKLIAAPPKTSHKYGNGNSVSKSNSSSSSSSTGSKPKSSNNSYDASAASDQHASNSQKKWDDYQQKKQPAPQVQRPSYTQSTPATPSYTTPNGRVQPVKQEDSQYWRGRLDQSKIERRDDRRKYFYASQYDYYHTRPRVFYDDPYDSDFWWWLRAQPTNVQAQWAYNHRYNMDQRRYNDLMMNMAVVSAISEMEANNTARNQYWAPSGVDADLMMSDGYVRSATVVPPTYSTAGSSGGHGFFTFLCVIFFLCFAAIVVWSVIHFFLNRGNEMFGKKATPKPPTAKTLQNPLKIEEGQYVNLTTLDEEGLQFQVRSISEWDRVINGHTHKFTDYSLVAKVPDKDDVRMRLRMNPTSEKMPVGLSQRILKLQLMDEMEFDPDFYEMIGDESHPAKDDAGNDIPDFVEKNDDDSIKAAWFRINDARGAYSAQIATVGLNSDGTHETSSNTVEYRDYNRIVKGESGHDQTEYLFVEIDHTNGRMIQIWKGVEIDESEVKA